MQLHLHLILHASKSNCYLASILFSLFSFFFCVVFVHVSVYIRSCRQFENAFVMALRFQVSDEKGHGDDTSANNLDSTDLGIKKKSISTTHMCTQTRLVFATHARLSCTDQPSIPRVNLHISPELPSRVLRVGTFFF